jgi:hypothetical protein
MRLGEGEKGGQARLLTEGTIHDDLGGMPRAARVAPGGMLFHVLNRGVGRMQLFGKEKDYAAFEGLLEQTLALSRKRGHL